eukprot:1856273-Pyramimonas_sp.AAC.1
MVSPWCPASAKMVSRCNPDGCLDECPMTSADKSVARSLAGDPIDREIDRWVVGSTSGWHHQIASASSAVDTIIIIALVFRWLTPHHNFLITRRAVV